MYNTSVEMGAVSQVLYFKCSDTNTIKSLYEKLENDTIMPEMAIATVSDDKYTGFYWKNSLNEDVLHTPYGRLFSAEEMDSGATVVLLGMYFLTNLSPENIDAVWETGIDISGTHFNAVGNYFFDSSMVGDEDYFKFKKVPTTITIPLKTYFDIGLVPLRFRCEFSQPLTSLQIEHLSNLLKSFSNIRSLSLPKTNNARAVNNYMEGIASYAVVLLLSLLSIVSVILYWLRKEFARYQIYLICGAKGRQIAYFISMNVTLIVTITYGCAFFAVSGITKITPPGMVSPSPWQFYVLIYFSVMIFMLLAVIIRAIPIIFREDMLK
ncbi:MAG: hypothetical protein ACYC5K_07745 [Saccharofermentanales bacterium]